MDREDSPAAHSVEQFRNFRKTSVDAIDQGPHPRITGSTGLSQFHDFDYVSEDSRKPLRKQRWRNWEKDVLSLPQEFAEAWMDP